MFAQEAAPTVPAAPGGYVGGAISVSVVVAGVILCWVGTKVWSWRWTQIVAGACIGVAGASGFIGDICRMIISIVVKAFTSVTAGF
jgi:hypothetical protein